MLIILSPSSPEHVKIVSGLRDLTVTAGEDALFVCEVSHDDYSDGVWWLGSSVLQKNEMNQMSCRGREHHLALTRASAEEAGIVAFAVGNERTSARLRVLSKPKSEAVHRTFVCQDQCKELENVQPPIQEPFMEFLHLYTFFAPLMPLCSVIAFGLDAFFYGC